MGMRKHRTFILGLIAVSVLYFLFALKKATLGFDFTDEGLYLVAPMELARGQPPFSADFMTLAAPFDLVSQLFFRVLGNPTLYSLRVCGWLVHISAYATLTMALYISTGRRSIAIAAAGLPFFLSFSCQTCIPTPNYNSLSSDFILVAFALYYLAAEQPRDGRTVLRASAGIFLFLSCLCYPPLGIVAACFFAYEAVEFLRTRHGGAASRCRSLAGSAAASLCGIALLAYLYGSGGASFWLRRFPLLRGRLLSSFQHGGVLSFYCRLIVDLLSKPPIFEFYSLATLAVILTALALRFFNKGPGLLNKLRYCHGLLSLYVAVRCYHGDDYPAHLYFSTAWCLVAIATFLVFFAASGPRDRSGPDPSPLGFVISMSVGAALVYAASTTFFNYYYCWNAALRGLPIALSFSLAAALGNGPKSRIASIVALPALAVAVYFCGRYNYYSVYRDSEVSQLRYHFDVPALKGIVSTKERVSSIDGLYAFMRGKSGKWAPLLAYDDCPMLYFLLDAKPAYGLCWARRDYVPDAVLRQALVEFLGRPLPIFAIRTLVDVSNIDWVSAPRMRYQADYGLNNFVGRFYRPAATIFPFEVLELQRAVGQGPVKPSPGPASPSPPQ